MLSWREIRGMEAGKWLDGYDVVWMCLGGLSEGGVEIVNESLTTVRSLFCFV